MNIKFLKFIRLLNLYINLLFKIEFKDLFMRIIDYKNIIFKY